MEALLTRLADVYQQAFSRIQIAAEQATQDAWYSLDSFSSDDEEEWSDALRLIVTSAATAAAYLAVSYVQAQLDVEGYNLTVPDPDLSWLDDDISVWENSPMVAARIAVSKGVDPREAMTVAATRVTETTNAVLRQAEQATLDQFIESIGIDVEIEYEERLSDGSTVKRKTKTKPAFRRVTQQGACGFCVVAADRLYTERAKKSHPLGAWHNFCRCTWRKVTTSEAQAWTQALSGGEWKSVIDRRANVSNSGE